VKIRWSEAALRDLREIGAFIGRDSRDAARRWVEVLQTRAEQVAEAPRSGRIVPEFARDEIREVLFHNYRIVYFLGRNEIAIMAVFEGHRLFPSGRIPPKE
jgi:plasmid stabilization system protein ParE